jgi:hypothetical protein
MNPRNRDLLVFTNKDTMDQRELERQIEFLNNLFYSVEASNAAFIANEIIDVNRYKVITNPRNVSEVLQSAQLRPFVFVSNKN